MVGYLRDIAGPNPLCGRSRWSLPYAPPSAGHIHIACVIRLCCEFGVGVGLVCPQPHSKKFKMLKFQNIKKYKNTRTGKVSDTVYGKTIKSNNIRQVRNKMKKLEYVDLKNAIANIEEAIKTAEVQLNLNKIALAAFEKALSKTKPPFADKETKEPEDENQRIGSSG